MSALPVRSLMFGGAALLLGGATFVLSQNLFTQSEAAARPAAAADLPSRAILVAARPLGTGAAIASGDLVWRAWPKSGIDKSFIVEGSRQLGDFTGQIVRTPVMAGEPVSAERLAVPGSRSALAVVVEPGHRAVSVSLNPTTGVSGLISPGDRVDVILTYGLPQPNGGGNERRAATTILTDLRVLAIDQRLSGAAGDTKDPRNASLEVTAKQSETLALAADLGKLSLSLRSLDRADAEPASGGSTIDYQVARLLPGLGSMRAAPAQSAAAPAAASAAPSRPAAPALTQFHGSKADGAEGTK